MAILESVRKLAEKLGADTNGRDITDQLNKINKHLDSTGSRDIAEAVSKFADKEDGTAILTTKSITENGTYKASDDKVTGYSSVSVDVESDPYFNSMLLSTPYITGDSSTLDFSLNITRIVYNPDGDYTIPKYRPSTNSQYQTCMLGTRAKKIDIANMYTSTKLIFNPDTDFEGFTNDGNPVTVTGASTDGATKNDTFVGYTTGPNPGSIPSNSIYLVKKSNAQFPFMCNIT